MSAALASRLPGGTGGRSPLAQVWLIVGMLVGLQYALNALVYFHVLPQFLRSKLFLLSGLLAVALSLFFAGKDGVKQLFIPYTRFASQWYWLLFALLWNFPLIMMSIPLSEMLAGAQPHFDRPHWIGWQSVLRHIGLLTAVALCDELFWIGFVLPRLLAAGYGPLKASLAIGVFWGFSYVPLVFTQFFVSKGLTIDSLVLGWFAMAPLYIWLYHKTSSALLVIIMSVSMQLSNWTMPVLPEPPHYDNGPVAVLNLLTLLMGMLLWKFPSSAAAQSGRKIAVGIPQ